MRNLFKLGSQCEVRWMKSSQHLLWSTLAIMKLMLLFGAQKSHLLFLWIVFDFSSWFYLMTFLLECDGYNCLLVIHVKVFSIISTTVYQYLYGPGGKIYIIAIIYIYRSLMNIRASTNYDYSVFFPIFIINSGWTFYYFGDYPIFETLTTSIYLILGASLLHVLIRKMGIMMDEMMNLEQDMITHVTKEKMIAIASHELRNPLQALTFLVSHLEPLSHLQQETILDIKSTVQLLNSITENVLDYSKIQAQRMKITNKKFNIVELIERIGAIFHYQAQGKGLSLYTHVDPAISVELIGDVPKISQILTNLTTNSIKFTKAGQIILSASLTEKEFKKICRIKLEVSDTGVGMTKQQIDSLFVPFGQLNDEKLADQRGWGLGLSITKDLVQILGGSIEVESIPGKSSNFMVSIPIEVSDPLTIAGCLTKASIDRFYILHWSSTACQILKEYLLVMGVANVYFEKDIPKNSADFPKNASVLIHQDLIEEYPTLPDYIKSIYVIGGPVELSQWKNCVVICEPITLIDLNHKIVGYPPESVRPRHSKFESLSDLYILIVEDNKLIHKAEKRILQDEGIKNIESAFNGQEAIDAIEKCLPFDCILMDVKMPILGGIEATKIIRNHPNPAKATVPIIIISGETVNFSEDTMCGVIEVLFKPVHSTELIALIQKLCLKKHLGVGHQTEPHPKNHIVEP